MKLVCISCPIGCELLVREDAGKITVEGNQCPRGEAYAREEITDPKRVLATSVKVTGGDYPLVSVRTDRPIPRRLIPEAMAFIRTLCVKAPVELGQIIVEDLLGSGAKLLATRTVRPADQTNFMPPSRGTASPR